ncbi:MAG: DUF2971 domain-containing protein [Pedobacter sp.]|nr:MAG: DUF2971 domain-containing protein [Pedobacter sp.]
MPETVDKLYHYTDINSLALILKSKSIRFGRLDKVNDPTEGQSSDFHSMAPYIFISSWTANQFEDLALWNMYTPLMRGVRIEIDLPIFASFSIPKNITNSLVNAVEYLNFEQGYFIVGAENKPTKIIYTDDEALLRPTIKAQGGLNLKFLSIYKRLIWQVEREYRYQLNIVPIDKNIQSTDFADTYSSLIKAETPPPIDNYLIRIRKKAFHSMKIRLSPKLLPGDRIIVESLIKSFNPTAVIEDSAVYGFIR